MKDETENALSKGYIVLTEDGERSTDEDSESETFATFGNAMERARELAEFAPGQMIAICEVVAVTRAPVGEPETARKYPIEHYRR